MSRLLFILSDAGRVRDLICALVLLAAGPAATAWASKPMTFHGFDEVTHSEEAEAGLQAIFGGHIFETAIPAQAAKFFLGALSTPPKETGLAPGSPEARFYMAGRFSSPPDRKSGADDGFGLGESVFQQDGKSMVTINCFACHAGVVNGQVVAGLGNNHINQSDPRHKRTRGDNFGPYAVWQMGAMLEDPANKGMVLAKQKTELQSLIDSLELPPVDPMPWWTMKYKKLNYWYADGGSHSPENFSINFSVPHPKLNENRAEHVKKVAKALAFARETVSPVYPGTLDAELVRKGADLFHGRTRPADATGFTTCKTCHGTYTRKEGHDDLSQPGSWAVAYDYSDVLRNVKTDPAYNSVLQQLRPVADHINLLGNYFAAQGTPELIPHASVPDRPGYVAPPLVGVWASAPYFHNGSVPTLDTVLNSAARPEIWARDHRDPHAYDLERVGMLYRDVTRADFEASASAAEGKPFHSQAAIDHSALYDTTAYGHGNPGHTFGDRLSTDERRAVIEFLKSLSGPDM
jgi:mono/diheme cytochrome c family protein